MIQQFQWWCWWGLPHESQVPFLTYPILMLENTRFSHFFPISKYFHPWTYCVSRMVIHLPSFYLKVALQVGTSFGGRCHGSYYEYLGNVSSCTSNVFLHLMFPLNITMGEESHPHILEGESEAWRRHWVQIPGAAGPGHDPAFCPSGSQARAMLSAPSRRTGEMCLKQLLPRLQVGICGTCPSLGLMEIFRPKAEWWWPLNTHATAELGDFRNSSLLISLNLHGLHWLSIDVLSLFSFSFK